MDDSWTRDDSVRACIDLVGRTGGRFFEIGYLHDDVPSEEAGWYAHVQFRGSRITVQDLGSPIQAVHALCVRLLTGAQCQHCMKLVALSDLGGLAFEGRLVDGRPWGVDDARRAGLCRWRLVGRVWVRGCEVPRGD